MRIDGKGFARAVVLADPSKRRHDFTVRIHDAKGRTRDEHLAKRANFPRPPRGRRGMKLELIAGSHGSCWSEVLLQR